MGPAPYKKGKQLGQWKAGGERRSQEWPETVRSLLDETLCPISTKDLSIRLALPAPAPPPRRRLLSVNTSTSNSDQFRWSCWKERVESAAFVLLEGLLRAAEVLELLRWCQTGNLGITYFCAHKGSREIMTFTRSMFGKKTSKNSWTLKALYK